MTPTTSGPPNPTTSNWIISIRIFATIHKLSSGNNQQRHQRHHYVQQVNVYVARFQDLRSRCQTSNQPPQRTVDRLVDYRPRFVPVPDRPHKETRLRMELNVQFLPRPVEQAEHPFERIGK